MVGHIDEIGLVITHIDEKGFLYFAPIGGWDPQILVGQRVTVTGNDGPVPGVAGRKPIHLLEPEQRKKVVQLKEMHIDIGADDREDAQKLVSVGDPVVIDCEPLEVAGGRLVSRSMDNRLGSYVALETARRVHENSKSKARFAGVAAVQEEIGLFGSRTAAFTVRPDLAVAIDVTHATDAPGIDEKEVGSHPFGSGPGNRPRFHPFPQGLRTAQGYRREGGHRLLGRRQRQLDPHRRRFASDLPHRHPDRARFDPAQVHAFTG